jgi:hypothetical protein
VADPREYLRQVREYIKQVQASVSPFQQRVERIGVSSSSLAEARAVLGQLRNIQKQLRQIKRNINLDMKAIRAEYSQKSSTAASMRSAFLRGAGKRGKAGRVRADAKRRLAVERDRKLAPYDSLKLQIDDLLVKLDGGKAIIETFISTAKDELQTQQQPSKGQAAPTRFCIQCGQPLGQSDRFCRECGHEVK